MSPRGKDFSRKFARGEWAERLIIDAINKYPDYAAFQYGTSRGDAVETQEELEELKEPDSDEIKRPDILVFEISYIESLPYQYQNLIEKYVSGTPDERRKILPYLDKYDIIEDAALAIEAKASNFSTAERNYSSALSIFVKDENYDRLQEWNDRHGVPVKIVQLFLDSVHSVRLDQAHPSFDGVRHGSIPGIPKDGVIFKLDSPYCHTPGHFHDDPHIVDGPESDSEIEYSFSKGGKIVSDEGDPFFSGGSLNLDIETLL